MKAIVDKQTSTNILGMSVVVMYSFQNLCESSTAF